MSCHDQSLLCQSASARWGRNRSRPAHNHHRAPTGSYATIRRVAIGGCLLGWILCLGTAPAGGQPVGSSDPPVNLWSRTTGEDWPRLLGPRGDGQSTEMGILTAWQGGLRLVWSRRLGVGYGNAVVADGRLFQWDRYGDQERLLCLSAETGQLLWEWEAPVVYRDSYGYNNGPRCSPVVDGRQVAVYGVAGRLAVLDVEDGRLLWQRQLNEEYGVVQNFFGVGATPIFSGDLLLVMVGGSDQQGAALPPDRFAELRGSGSAMVAFDRWSGEVRYEIGPYLASYSAPVTAELDGEQHCFALLREGLLSFRTADGQKQAFFPWRAQSFESVNASSPVVLDRQVLISECYGPGSCLLERDVAGDWQPVWRDPPGRVRDQALRSHWATPIRFGEYLLACSGRNQPDADLRCLRASDGQVQWTHRNRERTTLLAVDGHALVLGEYGRLELVRLDHRAYQPVAVFDLERVLHPQDGRPLLEYPVWAPPTLSHGLLYLRGKDRLICLELIPEA